MTNEHRTTTAATSTTAHAGHDSETFVRAMYQHHGTPLLRYAARLLEGDWHKAEDLLQEATARAWKHHSPTADPASLRPWMFTVVRNLAVDHHRARSIRPRETQTTDDLDLPIDDAIDQILTSQVVLDALHQLTPQQREIITLAYYRGYTTAQSAEHLDIPPGTVKSRTYYALRALKTALHARGILHP
ncbi:sigma-70 family RNA polymerase sigma factor [Streptomyces sp. NBC_00568]|uniref:sigma-70 family RNA polymerase sigma factor n=1 Tax=Streptomyces sp. NBC_00568 TaxID=2975779 RepID=UPI00225C0125|nr:sigma-70 family RNA polymerase sigma factor [Streptomyces sp. NBC_00568]MCX4993606.1 sigma-70 family RNA polymerase sigma factor [Streptomyces sp. NBC_00568]